MNDNNQNTEWPLWEVFYQPRDGKPFEHAGNVHAPDAEMALQIRPQKPCVKTDATLKTHAGEHTHCFLNIRCAFRADPLVQPQRIFFGWLE